MARGPLRRDETHILSKVSCFLLKSFHFRRLQKRLFYFSHTNPYILNVAQQCRCSPMLIFRAWTTCGLRNVSASELSNCWFSVSRQLRWLNTVLAVCEYILFAKSWQEKGCSSQAETWQVKNTLMKGFD